MPTRRTSASSFAVLALLLGATASPVRAQKTALLVGISTREAPSLPEFIEQRNQTILIESDGKTAKLVATLPDIIVPHGGGFWRVGMATSCTLPSTQSAAAKSDETSQEHNDSSWDEAFYMSPIEVSPKVLTLNKSPGQSCDPNPCTFHGETIWFVTSRFVSTDFYQGQSDACDPMGSGYAETHVFRLGGVDAISLKKLTGADGWEAYNIAVRDASYNLQQESANCEVFGDRSEVLQDTNWTLHRKQGKWSAMLRWQIGSGCEYVDDIDLELPRTITDYDTLRPSWASLEQQFQNLRDAFSSPAGNLLLVRTAASLAAYATDNGKVGPKLLELPAGRIVMAQWATGKYVDVWEKQLSSWERKGLPRLVGSP